MALKQVDREESNDEMREKDRVQRSHKDNERRKSRKREHILYQ